MPHQSGPGSLEKGRASGEWSSNLNPGQKYPLPALRQHWGLSRSPCSRPARSPLPSAWHPATKPPHPWPHTHTLIFNTQLHHCLLWKAFLDSSSLPHWTPGRTDHFLICTPMPCSVIHSFPTKRNIYGVSMMYWNTHCPRTGYTTAKETTNAMACPHGVYKRDHSALPAPWIPVCSSTALWGQKLCLMLLGIMAQGS